LFAIIHSTTISLPAWHCTCFELVPQVTADKDLKLRKYELSNNGWVIVGDFTSVLEKYKKATVFFS
jgi:hypothetical protein